MEKLKPLMQIYQCLALTAIAALLAAILTKLPVPFTLETLTQQRVSMQQIPLVHVQGGNMDVDVGNTVDVEGTVSIER